MEHNLSAYATGKCRCGVCRECNAAYWRQYRQKQQMKINTKHKPKWRLSGKSKGIQRVICGVCGITAKEVDVCQNQRLKH